MSLYWPGTEAEIVTDEPRLHALIIGVGAYEHLGLGVDHPSKLLTGLPPLTTTLLAAKRVARWFEEDFRNPKCPLGSIELLLSPAETCSRADGEEVEVEAARMGEVKQAFNRWYSRCNRNQDNIAVFYFAGHGVAAFQHFLLLADFGDPRVPDEWQNCIDATGMKAGMAKCKADTQLFFFDACRDSPIEVLQEKNPHGQALVSANVHDKAALSLAYTAASEGRKAYGRDDEETFFCKALVLCLDGAAARNTGSGLNVDTASLSSSMAQVMQVFAEVERQPLTGDFQAKAPVKEIHVPKSAAVVVQVDCESDPARREAEIQVGNNGNSLSSPRGEPRPWMGTVPAGPLKIAVSFQSFPTALREEQSVAPGTYPWRVPR